MSMDAVFSPNARAWVSPLILMEKRMKQMTAVRKEFLRPVDTIYESMVNAGQLPVPETIEIEMDEEAKEADRLRRERIFGKKKPPKGKKGRKGKKKDEAEEEDSQEEFDISHFFEDDEEDALSRIPHDDEDYVRLPRNLDEYNEGGEKNPFRQFDDSDRDTSSEEETGGAVVMDESDGEFDAVAFRKLQEMQPNAAAMAKQDEDNFQLHYKYCKIFAKAQDEKAKAKERKYIMMYFGVDEEKFEELWAAGSPHLATTKAEVIVEDPIFINTEMPLLAGAIPPLSVKKLSTLAIYTLLSDEPGNFQWRMVNVVDQLTNDLKFSKQNVRTRQLGELGPPDEVSDLENDCVLTVTMYQNYEIPEGDFFYDLKTSQEPKLGFVMEVLASQTLETLVGKLLCQSDFMCMTDMEATFPTTNPTDILTLLEKDLSSYQYKSKVVFINDTLYTDGGKSSLEYGKKLNAWVKQPPKKEIRPVKMGLLKDTQLKDLKLRFGYPYVYMHQGNCEHIIVFNSARAVRRVEYSEFPRFEKIGKYPTKYCRVDNESLARWAVVGYDRMPEDPMLLCTDCVNHYCYKDQKPVGNFKLFPFLQFLHFA